MADEDETVKTEPGEEQDSGGEVQKLRKSRSGTKAAITHKLNTIKELMADPRNVEQVFKMQSSLADIWAKFNDMHRQIMTLVAEDETATEEHNDYYEKEKQRMVDFDKICTEWIDTARNTILEDEIQPEDSASQISNGSKRSDRSSILRAALEEKAKRQAAEIRLRFLEKEENLKAEEEQLKRQRKLLAARKELEEAKSREHSWMEAARERSTVSRRSSSSKKSIEKTPSQSTAEDIIKQASAAFFLPRQEVPTFTGDPLEYNNFSIAFKTLIEEKTTCASSRLFYLAQYTNGDVKELVKSCFSMKPEEGYQEAQRLLKSRYGHSFRIATAYVDRIVKGAVIKSEDTVGLQKFSVQLTSCCNTLKQCGHINKVENPESFRAIVAKLPFELRRKWRSRADYITEEEERDIKFEDFVKYVEKEVRLASHPLFGNLFKEGEKREQKKSEKDKVKSFATSASQEKQSSVTPSNNSSFQKESSPSSNSKPPACLLCSGTHYLSSCQEFKKLSLDDRYSQVQKLGVCFNCLQKHLVKDCKTRQRCHVCGGKHFTLLHRYTVPSLSSNTSAQQLKPSTSPTASTGSCGAAVSEVAQCVSLQVVPVKVQAWDGTWVTTNAFLDNGSNMTFCSRALIDSLGLEGRNTTVHVTTLDHKEVTIEGKLFTLTIQDNQEGQFVTQLPAVVCRPELPVTLKDKATQRDLENWKHLKGISLLEDEAPIGLLIGNDHPEILQPLEVKQCPERGPYAVRTVLGWVVNGPLGKRLECKGTCNLIKASNIRAQIEQLYNQEFQESLADSTCEISVNDAKALKIMSESCSLKNGHYEMDLPLLKEVSLPNNRVLAERRLQHLKHRLIKNPELKVKYTAFMEDLFVKGYAEVIQKDQAEGMSWFLPHHAVINPNKPGKVRVVFDCSAKFKNVCLNDILLQGPDLNNSLLGVLLRFRQYPVALMSDIEAMFYQVRVSAQHRDLFRFLWWEGGEMAMNPRDCRMNVHIFGAKSSPTCCVYALQKTATDNDIDPVTKKVITRNFYMDDCLVSVMTEEEACELYHTLTATVAKGGFRLTKWISNSPAILEEIPTSERAVGVQSVSFSEDNQEVTVERTLGVRWNLQTDCFGFDNITKVIKEKTVTRRSILSTMSSVFDPLGLVAPAVLPAKRILQDLCRLQLGWDEPVPDIHERRWRDWLTALPGLASYQVPRCFLMTSKQPESYQLHHFSDASEVGYGSASYLRVLYFGGLVKSTLVMAKSRVTPLKVISIPRLELNAAALSVRMDSLIRKELQLSLKASIYWTDSTTVLKYIRNDDKRYHTFVANRIAAIRDGSTPSQWKYVDTQQNPADHCSRGLSPYKLVDNTKWTRGPNFLVQPPDCWPKLNEHLEPLSSDDPEVRKGTSAAVVSADIESPKDSITHLLEKFSSWFVLLRSTAWILRVKTMLRQRVKNRKEVSVKDSVSLSLDPITVAEMTMAELEVIKLVQAQSYPEEMSTLQIPHKALPKKSTLTKLNPVLENGLLKVKGRLSSLYNSHVITKPIIMPKDHHVTTLLIRHYHHLSGHSGREYVLALIRKKYWVIHGNSAVRRVLAQCVKCKKVSGRAGEQQMADIPEVRLGIKEAPFTRSGIDFFGPFLVKRGRSRAKRYALLITCLTTRAVHLEATFDLSTDSFLNALNRFISRRGKPKVICSDNGGSFVKAEKEIRQGLAVWNQGVIHTHLLQKNIDWQFNAPLASHHGGIWERCIRTARKIMNSILTEQLLDDEGLQTLLCEVESIMNGRPITPQSDDPTDPEALTPSHLLLFQADCCKLPLDVFTNDDCYGRRWRQVQHLANVFWRRWIQSYLPLLQKRQRWTSTRRNFKVGDLALLIDSSVPRNSWPLARVVETFPGSDGLVRQVKVRSRNGQYLRPIDKLVLLEGVSNNQ